MKAAAGTGAAFIAGGIDVINRLKFGAPINDLIYLGGIAGLDRIDADGSELRLGSLVTHDQLATSPLLRETLPGLAETWSDVANIRIRCKGTVGGNIMAGDPAYDFALAAAACGARLRFLLPDGGSTTVPASELSDLCDAGVLTTIVFPQAAACHLIFDRSLRPVVTIAIGLDRRSDTIIGGRLAIGCAYKRPLAIDLPLAAPLAPRDLAARAAALATAATAALPEPISDYHGTGAYRRRMIGVLLRRQLSALA